MLAKTEGSSVASMRPFAFWSTHTHSFASNVAYGIGALDTMAKESAPGAVSAAVAVMPS